MTSFVRKNLITINARFAPPGYREWNRETHMRNPPPTQPTQAEAVLKFRGANNSGPQTVTLPMTVGEDGLTWSVIWDSSASGQGVVSWVVYASGAVQSAAQGVFQISAIDVNNF